MHVFTYHSDMYIYTHTYMYIYMYTWIFIRTECHIHPHMHSHATSTQFQRREDIVGAGNVVNYCIPIYVCLYEYIVCINKDCAAASAGYVIYISYACNQFTHAPLNSTRYAAWAIEGSIMHYTFSEVYIMHYHALYFLRSLYNAF